MEESHGPTRMRELKQLCMGLYSLRSSSVRNRLTSDRKAQGREKSMSHALWDFLAY